MNWLKNIFRKPHKSKSQFCAREVGIFANQQPAPQDPSWTVDDTIAFGLFMQSATGLRLLQKSRAMRFACMESASSDTFNTSHSAGTANGMNEYEKWLTSLATIRISGETAVPVSNNTADAHQDEDALLKQYSP